MRLYSLYLHINKHWYTQYNQFSEKLQGLSTFKIFAVSHNDKYNYILKDQFSV